MDTLYYHRNKPAAWIRVSGEDSARFLQSQCSQDLRGQPGETVRYGLWLDAKGKVHADSFILLAGPETFYLYSYYCPAADIIAKLDAFIVADDVELEDLTDAVASIAFWGEGCHALKHLSGEAGLPGDAFYSTDNYRIFQGRRSAGGSFDLIINNEHVESVVNDLHPMLDEVVLLERGCAATQFERIRSGIPGVPMDIGPNDLPQEGGLDADAVSFSKGCYLGQEVMSRLHSMGKAQRGLYPVSTTEHFPATGAALYAGAERVGEMCSSVECEEGKAGMALLKHRKVAPGQVLSAEPGAAGFLTIVESSAR